eukprot:5278951-Prymnesium_polylepis.1
MGPFRVHLPRAHEQRERRGQLARVGGDHGDDAHALAAQQVLERARPALDHDENHRTAERGEELAVETLDHSQLAAPRPLIGRLRLLVDEQEVRVVGLEPRRAAVIRLARPVQRLAALHALELGLGLDAAPRRDAEQRPAALVLLPRDRVADEGHHARIEATGDDPRACHHRSVHHALRQRQHQLRRQVKPLSRAGDVQQDAGVGQAPLMPEEAQQVPLVRSLRDAQEIRPRGAAVAREVDDAPVYRRARGVAPFAVVLRPV